MLKKAVELRNCILIIGAGLVAITLGLFLVLGDSDEKIKLTAVTAIVALLFYGFIRLGFPVILKNASKRTVTVFSYFFLICGSTVVVLSVLSFCFSGFPNGYNPSGAGALTLAIGVLDFNKKHNN